MKNKESKKGPISDPLGPRKVTPRPCILRVLYGLRGTQAYRQDKYILLFREIIELSWRWIYSNQNGAVKFLNGILKSIRPDCKYYKAIPTHCFARTNAHFFLENVTSIFQYENNNFQFQSINSQVELYRNKCATMWCIVNFPISIRPIEKWPRVIT